MRPSSPLLENFLHAAYPETNLPPLWQVIYQEAVRGNHLLFKRSDVENFDNQLTFTDHGTDLHIPEEVEYLVLNILSCPDLQSMVRLIDRQSDRIRRTLYELYRRVLWMWRHYVRGQLN